MKNIIAGLGIALAAAQLSGCDNNFRDKPGNLGYLSAVRSALQVYYGDTEGVFPETLAVISSGGKYMSGLHTLKLPGHKETNEVLYLSGPVMDPSKLTDTGGYAYYNSKEYPQTYGMVIINCTHQDKKGNFMYSF